MSSTSEQEGGLPPERKHGVFIGFSSRGNEPYLEGVLSPEQEREVLINSVGNDPNLKAAISNAHSAMEEARRQYQAGHFEKAQDQFVKAVKIVDSIMGVLLERGESTWSAFLLQFAAAARFELSVVLLSISPNWYEEAIKLLQDARKLYEKTGWCEAVADTWNALADLYGAVGDMTAAQAARNEAIRVGGTRST